MDGDGMSQQCSIMKPSSLRVLCSACFPAQVALECVVIWKMTHVLVALCDIKERRRLQQQLCRIFVAK